MSRSSPRCGRAPPGPTPPAGRPGSGRAAGRRASVDRWATRTPSRGSSSTGSAPVGLSARTASRPASTARSRARSHTCGARSGPAATSTRAPDRRSSSAMCSRDSALLIGAAMPASLGGQGRGDQLLAVRREQGDAVGPAHAEGVEHVRVAVHVGEQLRVSAAQRLLPALRVGQHGVGDAVRPPPGGPHDELVRRAGQPAIGQRDRLDLREVAGLVVRRPEQVAHHALRTTVRWRPRSIVPSSVPMDELDDVAVLEVLRVLGLALEEELPLQRGRQELGDELDRLGRCAERGALGRAGEDQVARFEPLEPAQGLQCLERGSRACRPRPPRPGAAHR